MNPTAIGPTDPTIAEEPSSGPPSVAIVPAQGELEGACYTGGRTRPDGSRSAGIWQCDEQGRRLWSNLEEDDEAGDPDEIGMIDMADLQNQTGEFVFVVMPDESMRVLRPGGIYGHMDLAQKQQILMGGHMWLEDGVVVTFNNYSGHYKPYGPQLQGIAEEAFRRNGLAVADDVVYKPRVWKR